MNEQLQEALTDAIAKFSDAATAGAGFLQAEIPEVITQLLTWCAVESIIMCVTAVLVLIAWVKIEFLACKLARDDDAENSGDLFFFYIALGTIPRVILLAIVCMLFSLDWLKIIISPKIWLIEYAANLVK